MCQLTVQHPGRTATISRSSNHKHGDGGAAKTDGDGDTSRVPLSPPLPSRHEGECHQQSWLAWAWDAVTIAPTVGFVEGGPNTQLCDRSVIARRELYKGKMYRGINMWKIAYASLFHVPQVVLCVATAAVISGQAFFMFALLDEWVGLGVVPRADATGEWDWGVFTKVFIGSSLGAVAMFHATAGHLYRKYYVKQRADAHKWKIQPQVWPSDETLKGQSRLSTVNAFMGSMMSAFYVYRMQRYGIDGMGTKLYATVAEAGGPVPILTVFLQFVLVMIWDDAFAYYAHRWFHTRFMYKHFHKWHHLYKAPTPYAALALHPVELFLFTLIPFQTAFLFRQHIGVYLFHLCWILYYTVEDHSGIMRTSSWPWQQDSCFHDQHHEHFHCNFGLTTYFWDWLHGTIRNPKSKYDEKTFVGDQTYGKSA